MNVLYRILDVRYGFHIAKQGMSRAYGGSARTLFVTYGLLTALLLLLLWRYDIQSTYDWGEPWARALASDLPSWLDFGPYTINIISTLIGFSSVIVQFAFPSLASYEAAKWAFAIAAIFDLVTDAPRVIEDTNNYLVPFLEQQFNLSGPLLSLATYAAYGFGTVAASFVVQSLFFVTLACCVYLYPRMSSPSAHTAEAY